MSLENLVDDTTFFPVLQALKECLCEELGKAGGPSLCFCGLSVGQPPFGLMDCKDGKACGIAWVSPVTAFPSLTFPAAVEPGTQGVGCGTRLVMQVEVGVARCAPRAPQRGTTYDPQDTFDKTRLYMSDMQAARRAILCCLPLVRLDGGRKPDVAIEAWSPIDVASGASGGTWTAYIG